MGFCRVFLYHWINRFFFPFLLIHFSWRMRIFLHGTGFSIFFINWYWNISFSSMPQNDFLKRTSILSYGNHDMDSFNFCLFLFVTLYATLYLREPHLSLRTCSPSFGIKIKWKRKWMKLQMPELFRMGIWWIQYRAGNNLFKGFFSASLMEENWILLVSVYVAF